MAFRTQKHRQRKENLLELRNKDIAFHFGGGVLGYQVLKALLKQYFQVWRIYLPLCRTDGTRTSNLLPSPAHRAQDAEVCYYVVNQHDVLEDPDGAEHSALYYERSVLFHCLTL